MTDVASGTACLHDDGAIGSRPSYPAIETPPGPPNRPDDQLEAPLQPFLLRERRSSPIWIITRR